MIDRQALLKQYGALVDSEGIFIKALDLLYYAENHYEPQITDFLTPDLSFAIEQIAKSQTDLIIQRWGVFSEAERVKLFIAPDYVQDIDANDHLALIDIQYNQKFNELGHSDALGALMALGINRSKLGDIVVYEGGFQVVLDSSLCAYFLQNVDKIGRAGVKVKKISFDEAKAIIQNKRAVSGTVKSIRLDSIIALCFSLSRSDAQKLVESEHVKVNHGIVNRTDYVTKMGDLISVRGHGRLVVEEILGVTKKDRIRVVLSVVTR